MSAQKAQAGSASRPSGNLRVGRGARRNRGAGDRAPGRAAGIRARRHGRRRRRLLTIVLPLFLALACAGAAWLLRAQLPPENVIGGAEALTGIQVVGDAPFALWQALLAAGGIAALCALAFALRELKNRRKTS